MAALSLVKTRGSRKDVPRPVKLRLNEALTALTVSPGRAQQRPTISTLCRLADVSRNTLYRYYPDMAKRMQRLRRRRISSRSVRESVEKALHLEVAALRAQVAKLASLADHYYAAAQEQRAGRAPRS